MTTTEEDKTTTADEKYDRLASLYNNELKFVRPVTGEGVVLYRPNSPCSPENQPMIEVILKEPTDISLVGGHDLREALVEYDCGIVEVQENKVYIVAF